MKEKIKNITITKLEKPKNIETYEVSYTQGAQRYHREVTKALNVVKVLIYHKSKDAFILVKQFRPLVYINLPEMAIRYELCGGREDKKGLSSEEIAKEEVLEETGYKVDRLEKITQFVTTAKMTLYYAEVDESNRVNSGGGVENEHIELVYLPIKEAKAFMFNETIPKRPALMFSFCWFLSNRCKDLGF